MIRAKRPRREAESQPRMTMKMRSPRPRRRLRPRLPRKKRTATTNLLSQSRRLPRRPPKPHPPRPHQLRAARLLLRRSRMKAKAKARVSQRWNPRATASQRWIWKTTMSLRKKSQSEVPRAARGSLRRRLQRKLLSKNRKRRSPRPRPRLKLPLAADLPGRKVNVRLCMLLYYVSWKELWSVCTIAAISVIWWCLG